jgi:hypothetical protein
MPSRYGYDIACSQSTLYRMIENGMTITQKIDERRCAHLKHRYHYVFKQKKDPSYMEERRYSDFITYLYTHYYKFVEIDAIED